MHSEGCFDWRMKRLCSPTFLAFHLALWTPQTAGHFVLPRILTALLKPRSLNGMTVVVPTIFGLNTEQLEKLAQLAVHDAVRTTVQTGNSVTGLVDGEVVTLLACDPKFAHFRAETPSAA